MDAFFQKRIKHNLNGNDVAASPILVVPISREIWWAFSLGIIHWCDMWSPFRCYSMLSTRLTAPKTWFSALGLSTVHRIDGPTAALSPDFLHWSCRLGCQACYWIVHLLAARWTTFLHPGYFLHDRLKAELPVGSCTEMYGSSMKCYCESEPCSLLAHIG